MQRLLQFAVCLALAPPLGYMTSEGYKSRYTLAGPARIQTIEEKIVLAAIARGLEPGLALAVAWRESKFLAGAVGSNEDGSHDWGVFQLNDGTVRAFQMKHPLDPAENIALGVRLLAQYRTECKTVAGALYAYARGHCPIKLLEGDETQ